MRSSGCGSLIPVDPDKALELFDEAVQSSDGWTTALWLEAH
jgi:hypothetical protein